MKSYGYLGNYFCEEMAWAWQLAEQMNELRRGGSQRKMLVHCTHKRLGLYNVVMVLPDHSIGGKEMDGLGNAR